MIVEFILYASLTSLIAGYFVYRFDKYEREPLIMLWLSASAGMLSTVLVLVMRKIFPFLVFSLKGSTIQILLGSFITAGAMEEGAKLLLFIPMFRKWKEINEPYDVMLYFGFVGLGFGVYENLGYVFHIASRVLKVTHRAELVRSYAFKMSMLRWFPAHLVIDFIAGYFLAKVLFKRNKTRGILYGYLVAVGIHGLYDVVASLLGYAALMVYAFLLLGLAVFLGIRATKESLLVKGMESLTPEEREEAEERLEDLEPNTEKPDIWYVFFILFMFIVSVFATIIAEMIVFLFLR